MWSPPSGTKANEAVHWDNNRRTHAFQKVYYKKKTQSEEAILLNLLILRLIYFVSECILNVIPNFIYRLTAINSSAFINPLEVLRKNRHFRQLSNLSSTYFDDGYSIAQISNETLSNRLSVIIYKRQIHYR